MLDYMGYKLDVNKHSSETDNSGRSLHASFSKATIPCTLSWKQTPLNAVGFGTNIERLVLCAEDHFGISCLFCLCCVLEWSQEWSQEGFTSSKWCLYQESGTLACVYFSKGAKYAPCTREWPKLLSAQKMLEILLLDKLSQEVHSWFRKINLGLNGGCMEPAHMW